MLQDVKDLTSPGVIKGLNTQYNILALQKDQSPNMMNVKVNYDGSFEKRLGSNTQNTVAIATSSATGFSVDSNSTLTDSIYSYWNMNESDGTRMDAFGRSNLTAMNSPSYASGKVGQCASFIATSNQYLYTASTTQLCGNTQFSIAGWFYLNDTSKTAQRTIVSKVGNAGEVGIDANAIGVYHFDNNYDDSSATANNGTVIGTATTSTTIKKFGSASLELNGASAISLPDNASYDFKNDFTLEGFVNFTNIQACNPISRDNAANSVLCGITFDGVTLYGYAGADGSAVATTWSPNTAQWYHLAFCRASSAYRLFIDGSQVGSTGSGNADLTGTTPFTIGAFRQVGPTYVSYLSGWVDEVRISNVGRYTANFTPPTAPYANSAPSDYEYKIFVDTDNKLVFSASSSGTATDGEVRANSIGALTTATWYNFVAYHNATTLLALSVNYNMNTATYLAGIRAGTGNFYVGGMSSLSCFNGRIDEVGVWTRVLSSQEISDIYNGGTGNTYTNAFLGYPWAAFDFGAGANRWLMCSAGTGVYCSSNLGNTWAIIATDRTATYQYMDRSKNVLIMTSEAYDNPIYWAGSAGSYAAIIGTSTPLAKYSINFQGYLILLNTNTRKRSFNYLDENYQLTSTGWLNFDLPSSADDEITNVFVLRRYLYVSTRYKIFRVSYVGGNPDWQYIEVKGWGFVPRTCKRVVITSPQGQGTTAYSIGEVVIGLTYDRKLRIFDGYGDMILSNNVEKDNGLCDFALDKISYSGSGPLISFAEVDPIPNVYSLCVAIGQNSTQTTHFLNYDGRCQALYPYSNMYFNCMCIAESANRQFLMAFDRSGICHMMNSGNLDGNIRAFDDFFTSPLMFEKTPSQSNKGHKTDLFFSNTTAGDVYYYDRKDFSNHFDYRKKFCISGSENKIIHYESVDIPETYNVYQFMVGSSAGNSNPWRLQRYDHFTKGLGIGRNE